MKKADSTKMHILNKSFELIYINGYQATSIDKIIDTTQVTKGAFYYHFKDKEKMGLSMIDEVLLPRLNRILIQPIQNNEKPLEAIFETIKNNLLRDADFDRRYGCPMNNLVQEMSPINERFKTKLKGVIKKWKTALTQELDRAKELGHIDKNVNTDSVADFIIVSYEGLRATGKLEDDLALYKSYLKQLKNYLESLK